MDHEQQVFRSCMDHATRFLNPHGPSNTFSKYFFGPCNKKNCGKFNMWSKSCIDYALCFLDQLHGPCNKFSKSCRDHATRFLNHLWTMQQRFLILLDNAASFLCLLDHAKRFLNPAWAMNPFSKSCMGHVMM